MKKVIRYLIYLVLFSILIGAFIYLGKKDYGTDYNKISDAEKFSMEYNISNDNMFKYIYTNDVIDILNNKTGLIFMGFSSNEWSQYYVKYLYQVLKEKNVNTVYYYDLLKDRARYTKNYIAIEKILNPFLTKLDDNSVRINTPILVFVKDGKIVYINSETAINNNNLTPKEYWDYIHISNFKEDISSHIESTGIYG